MALTVAVSRCFWVRSGGSLWMVVGHVSHRVAQSPAHASLTLLRRVLVREDWPAVGLGLIMLGGRWNRRRSMNRKHFQLRWSD